MRISDRRDCRSNIDFIYPHLFSGEHSPHRQLTFPIGRMECFYVFQVLVLLYKCEQNTKCCVFALESLTPQGEREGIGTVCKRTIVPAPFVWFLYYTIILNIIILFLLSFGEEEGREWM